VSDSRFDPANVSFGLSGDPDEDAKTAASIRKHLANESEGLCPNGCAPLTWPRFDHEAVCPKCGFTGWGMNRKDYDPLLRSEVNHHE
jgi:hypothetical protein